MRLILAIRAFFAILSSPPIASQMERLLAGDDAPPTSAPSQPPPEPAAKPVRRSEALTLLAAMQREARFVDLVLEPLGDYSDAQIGAAARDVLRDCEGVLKRMFNLQPLLGEQEGADIEVATGFDPGRYRLTGKRIWRAAVPRETRPSRLGGHHVRVAQLDRQPRGRARGRGRRS